MKGIIKRVFLGAVTAFFGLAVLEAFLETGWLVELAPPIGIIMVFAGIMWPISATLEKSKKKKAVLNQQLAEIDERLRLQKLSNISSKEAPRQDAPIHNSLPSAPKRTRLNFALGCVAIPTSIAIFAGLVAAVGSMAGIEFSSSSYVEEVSQEQPGDANASDSSAETSGGDVSQAKPVDTKAKYFGSKIVPLFVGYSAESAVRMLDKEFDERFFRIEHSNTGERLSTRYSRERDFAELEGLFVCEQSIGAGILVEYSWKMGNIKISVSEACGGIEPLFVAGAAAEFLGRYVPPELNLADCNSSAESCDVRAMDGMLVDFLDSGYNGHKTALVKTVYGDLEVELAMIDLAADWCAIDDDNDSAMLEKALAVRDELLPNGTLIRMVGGDELYGARRLVHVLNEQGELVNGEIPTNSVNELLVASGFWVPVDISDHPWDRIYSIYSEDLESPEWTRTRLHADAKSEGEILMDAYAGRITAAANDAFTQANSELGLCLDDKEEQVLVLASNSSRNTRGDDDRDRVIVVSPRDDEDSFSIDSIDCEGDAYYEWPGYCDGGKRLIEETAEELRQGLDIPESGTSSDSDSSTGSSGDFGSGNDESLALDCEGDAYYEWPILCDGGARLTQETLRGEGPYGSSGSDRSYDYGGGSSGGTSVGGSRGGSNCTWVRGHYRNGNYVRGHTRCR